MDGPLAETVNGFHFDTKYAIDETAKFIALVRKNYPNVKIGDIEPFPGLALPVHQAWLELTSSQIEGNRSSGIRLLSP